MSQSAPARTPAASAESAASPESVASPRTPAALDPGAAGVADRLMSLDAYRGFIMIAMASASLGIPQVARQLRDEATKSGATWDGFGRWFWETLAYQFDHAAWTGCAFWDLIQPSFMFMVGVAMPFSYGRRRQQGESELRRFAHVLWRSLVLVALGVFLSSNGSPLTNFTFVNVLSQIGLGYPFLYLLHGRSWRVQFGTAVVVLVGSWLWFAAYTIPDDQRSLVRQTLVQDLKGDEQKADADMNQFVGFASHWNKHVNAAAAVDREFLNWFPRREEPRHGRAFWTNNGGYQTMNFVPALATMIFGLMAGTLLRSDGSPHDKVRRLLRAGALCFACTMAIDTTIWPFAVPGCNWTLCPSVKRIWTPTWAVFSTGWTCWMLAAFYWTIDVRRWRAWAWPCVVVGMNSIVMYCMSQTLKPWVKGQFKTHLATLDAWFGWNEGLVYHLFTPEKYAYAAIWERVAVLGVFWLVCLWMYRRRIWVRI